MLKKVTNYINENKLLEKKDKVLVALSGGPDSVCLLHILYKLKDIFNIELGAIHINHMLRGEESDKDEKYIGELCEKLGINYYVKRIDIEYIAKQTGVSLEVAGRNERYNAFEEVKKEHEYTKIAIAHNANDQAETILMRMMRGTGLEGLVGIKASREGGIIRPILCLNREEIEKYCEDSDLRPRIDASNYERVYSRNKVRLDILPYMKENFNRDIIDTLNRMAILLQRDNEFIEEYSKESYEKYCKTINGELIIYNKLFKEEKESIITRVIIRAFKNMSNSHQNFEMKHIYEVINLVNKGTGKKINLTNKIVAENTYGNIILRKNKDNYQECVKVKENINILRDNIPEKIEFNNYNIYFELYKNETKVEFSKNSLIKLFDYDKIKEKIIVRHRKEGDRMIPLGMSGNKKIKDIFINAKIPKEERDLTPILCFDEKISWVVGLKTSQEFKVTKDTKTILRITFERKG